MDKIDFENIHLYCGDAIELYSIWETPVVIICDGPYGVSGFPGDLVSYRGLSEWYEPHIKKWSSFATPLTTLWFWCTEVGWATVHPMLEKHGWDYVSCCVWDKGIGHIAGNTNTKTIRQFIQKIFILGLGFCVCFILIDCLFMCINNNYYFLSSNPFSKAPSCWLS